MTSYGTNANSREIAETYIRATSRPTSAPSRTIIPAYSTRTRQHQDVINTSYSREESLKYLRFHADVLVPLLGPYPQKFQSSTRSGLPIELSVNYRQHATKPRVVRIGFEPIDDLSGTSGDPSNKVPAIRLVSMLAETETVKGFDTQRWARAVEELTVDGAEEASLQGKKIEGGYIKSQSAFGFDLVGGGEIVVKGYIFARAEMQSHRKANGPDIGGESWEDEAPR
ncbi:tryptophan dimethylallyltransferase-domain-containing protein [Aspergillus falconensis]